ncbi:MAG TPA: cyclase family protein [Candidatus Limnocylindrales bacterium]|jgi:kynurenine formamidase|nr:cyclase family protein [Candidatus Limnocylindrales bacterium]
MAKPKKKVRKAAPKARKVAPKAVKRKTVKAAKRPAPKKSGKPLARRVADIVTAATRATVDIESAAGRMERAAVRKVGEVAARATRAMRGAVAQSPKIPSYDELPVRAGAPAGAAWGVFGDDDEVGTINLLTPERVVAATSSIRTGKVFALNLPINIPDPPLFTRGKHTHTVKIFPNAEFVLDDFLDNFYPQASSQWDALAHVKHPIHGAYNGIPDIQMTGRGGTRLGIDNLARRGIAGRGVLADVARYYDRVGKSINFTKSESIPLDDVKATLEDEGVELQDGDILLIRIGWTKFYLSASAAIKEELAKETVVPGIEGSERTARWLWDNHLAAVASDSPALEALPKPAGEEMEFLHFHMLAFFGMPIGEMWNLEGLAEDCAADGNYDFFLTSAPLNIPGGVGSPPNALAIK